MVRMEACYRLSIFCHSSSLLTPFADNRERFEGWKGTDHRLFSEINNEIHIGNSMWLTMGLRRSPMADIEQTMINPKCPEGI